MVVVVVYIVVIVLQYNSCCSTFEVCFADIDECNTGTDLCEEFCHNVVGSYWCSCPEGYELEPQWSQLQRYMYWLID